MGTSASPVSVQNNSTYFDQDLFIEALQLSKPLHAIPESLVDKEKGRLPFEAWRLMGLVRGNTWNTEQLDVHSQCKHLCKGITIPEFNAWRWITLQTSLLMSDALKSIQAEQKDQTAIILPFIQMMETFDEGVEHIEDYLSASSTDMGLNLQHFDKGKKRLSDAYQMLHSTHSSLSSKIKNQLLFLIKCLDNKKDLFPILLLPTTQNNQICDYSACSIDAVQKITALRSQEVYRLLDNSFEPYLKRLKELLSHPLPNLKKKAALLSAIQKISSHFGAVRKFWGGVDKIYSDPSLRKVREFAKQAEESKPLTLARYQEWMKTARHFAPPSNAEENTYYNAVQPISSDFREITDILLEYFKDEGSTQKTEKEEANFTCLREFFDTNHTSIAKNVTLVLVTHFEQIHAILTSLHLFETSFWAEQKEGMDTYQNWLAGFPSKIPPSFELLIEGLCRTIPSIYGSDAHLFKEFAELISMLRMYDEQLLTLSNSAKPHYIRSILEKLDFIEQFLQLLMKAPTPSIRQWSSSVAECISSLRLFLGATTAYYNDLFFLLHKVNLSQLDNTSLQELLRANLLIPEQYLNKYKQPLDQSNPAPPLSASSFGQREQALVLPLATRLEDFKKEALARQKQLQKLLNQDLKTIARFLIEFKKWANSEKNAFLAEYTRISDTLASAIETKEVDEKIFDHLTSLLEAFTDLEYEKLDTFIFSPTHSLQKWEIQNSLEKRAQPQITAPTASYPTSAASSSSSAPPASAEKPDLPVLKPIDLINQLSRATCTATAGPDLYAQDCLDNIRIDLLPSILEIVDKTGFSQRLFEKTKLLLEQSLKFALAKQNQAALFEKTDDWRQQQRVASHSLLNLFAPLASSFKGEELTQVLSYFSSPNPSEDLREFVGKAFIASERLVRFSTKEPEAVILAPLSPSRTAHVEVSAAIDQAFSNLTAAVLQKRDSVSQKEQLHPYIVQKIGPKETKHSMMRRQFCLTNCLETMEKSLERLRVALSEAREDTPLAYCAELCHTSSLLLENALVMLIAYYRIQGEGSEHKLFQTVSSQTQARVVRHIHHLQKLSEIIQTHLKKEYYGERVFDDPSVRDAIETFQTYNSRTHRYLAQDQTAIGEKFRKLHEEMQWGGSETKEFASFRNEYIHPKVIHALEATTKLLEALPL